MSDGARPALRVESPGLLTTVQDLGRYGYGRFGLPVAGALDDCALRWANLLVGNAADAAGLELTQLGPTLTLLGDHPVLVALTGADFTATVNGRSVAPWQSFVFVPGATLKLGVCQAGARGYLAIAGGVDVPLAFGSRSTDTLGRIGGVAGRALVAGDLVPLAPPPDNDVVPRMLPPERRPEYTGELTLRVVLGTQDDRFTEDAIVTFLSSPYRVTREADRMGARLEGPPLTFVAGPRGADILSEGVATGAIQVPGHGQPIVLLAAHQTTGGYAKIATVITADLWRLGQARAGNRVRFRRVSLAEAHQALRTYQESFNPTGLVVVPGAEALSSDEREREARGMGDESSAGNLPAGQRATWGPAEVHQLLERIAALGLAEFELEQPGFHLRVRRETAAHERATGLGDQADRSASVATPTDESHFTIAAPFLGIFYRAAREGEAPFVAPGDIVEPDQTLGLLEVMKTFHPVTAERRARVVEVLAEDATPVEYGQPLFTLAMLPTE